MKDPMVSEAPLSQQATFVTSETVKVTVRTTGHRPSFDQKCHFRDITESFSSRTPLVSLPLLIIPKLFRISRSSAYLAPYSLPWTKTWSFQLPAKTETLLDILCLKGVKQRGLIGHKLNQTELLSSNSIPILNMFFVCFVVVFA